MLTSCLLVCRDTFSCLFSGNVCVYYTSHLWTSCNIVLASFSALLYGCDKMRTNYFLGRAQREYFQWKSDEIIVRKYWGQCEIWAFFSIFRTSKLIKVNFLQLEAGNLYADDMYFNNTAGFGNCFFLLIDAFLNFTSKKSFSQIYLERRNHNRTSSFLAISINLFSIYITFFRLSSLFISF